jgi:hypothetical protein
MDLIREHLIYKDVPIVICMAKLKPQEQYEIIRLLLATRKTNVKVCLHGILKSYLMKLIDDVGVEIIQTCSESQGLSVSDLLKK